MPAIVATITVQHKKIPHHFGMTARPNANAKDNPTLEIPTRGTTYRAEKLGSFFSIGGSSLERPGGGASEGFTTV
jgi:hypothetical protein